MSSAIHHGETISNTSSALDVKTPEPPMWSLHQAGSIAPVTPVPEASVVAKVLAALHDSSSRDSLHNGGFGTLGALAVFLQQHQALTSAFTAYEARQLTPQNDTATTSTMMNDSHNHHTAANPSRPPLENLSNLHLLSELSTLKPKLVTNLKYKEQESFLSVPQLAESEHVSKMQQLPALVHKDTSSVLCHSAVRQDTSRVTPTQNDDNKSTGNPTKSPVVPSKTLPLLPTTISRRGTRKTCREMFPEKFHRILRELEERGQDDIASFVNGGNSFEIHQPDVFEMEVIPQYFRQCGIGSFKKQLHLYGFSRLKQDCRGYATTMVFYHEKFKRDQPELCLFMDRIKKRPKVSQAASPK